MSHKTNLAFCIGATKTWLFAAANVILSITDNFKGACDFVIFLESPLSAEEKRIFGLISNNIHFVLFDTEKIKSEKFRRVSKMAFARYECFPLLERYHNVIWIDADACCVADISAMLDHNPTGIAMLKHKGIPMRVSFSKDVPGINMETECFNDGVLVLNDQIPAHKDIAPLLYQYTHQYIDFVNSDQAVVNLLLQKQNLVVSELPYVFNQRPEDASLNSKILHPWGEGKFWDRYYLDQWDRNYVKWKRLGGFPLQGYETFRNTRALRKRRLLKSLLFWRSAKTPMVQC